MDTIKIIPTSLNGIVEIPPSKSLSHRAIIAASLSNGTSCLYNYLPSNDVEATLNGMEGLGADISRENTTLIIKGCYPLKVKNSVINCKESGSTLRFLIPISRTLDNSITFTGEGRLPQRPIDTYIDLFNKQGIIFKKGTENLPLTIKGKLQSGEFKIAGDISSQFVTGLLFTLPLLDYNSKIILTSSLQSKPYVDMTCDVLRKFSIDIVNNNYSEFMVKGGQRYNSTKYTIEGDYSQGAFFLAAGVLGGCIETSGLTLNSHQGDRVIINAIKEMGGNLQIKNNKITAVKSDISGITFDASEAPDLVPAVAILGAFAKGQTRIMNAERLRYKESDRLHALYVNLLSLGSNILETSDGLVIKGKEYLNGGNINSFNDHRIAMAFAVASVRCKNPLFINNKSSVEKSYPHFWSDFIKLGGRVINGN